MFERQSAGDGVRPVRAPVPSLRGGPVLWLWWLSCFAVAPVAAQVADTTAVLRPDTTAVPPEGGPPRSPVGFTGAEPGVTAGTTLPVRSPALDVPGILAAVPGSFVYDFGTPGWPDGWSRHALRPDDVVLLFNGLPFDDLITGRPRYDLVPLTFLEPLRLAPARDGAPVGVLGQLRAYDAAQPLTEIRYRTSNTGLQSVTVMHAQQRTGTFFGRPGRFQLLFGYGGQGARGEYPGSRLRRARRLLWRLRYERRNWSVELMELFNRRRVGAHGGVRPFDENNYETIYQRLGATVEEPEAKRETIRNDLALTVRARLLPGAFSPAAATGFWTRERFQYRNPADTLTGRMQRLGVRVQQDVQFGVHWLRLRLEARHDGLRDGAALPDTLNLSRDQWHVALRDTLALAGTEVVLEGGYHRDDGVSFPSGLVRLRRGLGPVQVFVEATHSGVPVSRVARWGFGGLVEPLAVRPDSRLTLGRAGFTLHAGPFDVTAYAFAWRQTRPVDLYATGRADTVAVRVGGAPLRYAGVSADVAWRRRAERGLYMILQPTFAHLRNPGDDPLFARRAESLPERFATGRLGARMLLFQGDLDLDLYVQGRYWSDMRSRVLQPQTGLLLVPEADARSFDPSGALDVYFVGRVRGATVFLAYENVLSGTQVQVGNLIVPDYPLPRRRFRFGVFWPILN